MHKLDARLQRPQSDDRCRSRALFLHLDEARLAGRRLLARAGAGLHHTEETVCAGGVATDQALVWCVVHVFVTEAAWCFEMVGLTGIILH